MCISVICDDEYCAYNRDGTCGKEIISISRKAFSGFRNGERERAHDCADYKETGEDDVTD